jgi:hypothetical protein
VAAIANSNRGGRSPQEAAIHATNNNSETITMNFSNGPLIGGRKAAIDVMVVVHRHPDLLEVVSAVRTPRSPATAHGWQQERNEQRNDTERDEKLDKREAPAGNLRRCAAQATTRETGTSTHRCASEFLDSSHPSLTSSQSSDCHARTIIL